MNAFCSFNRRDGFAGGCLCIGDAFSGGTSAEQTTQTVSGTSRGVTGKKNQYTESGAISAGQSYLESGSLQVGKNGKVISAGGYDLSKTKAKNITIQNNGVSGDQIAAIAAQFNGNTTPTAGGAGASVAVNPGDPNSGTTQTADTSTTTSTDTSTLKEFWTALPQWKKTSAAVLIAVLIWFLFFRRR